jgi:predicted XRE-type DNA-binding protein
MDINTFRTKLTRDIQSRVARQLGLSRSHVCEVANGHRRSRRVQLALEKEYARVDREVRGFERKTERAA